MANCPRLFASALAKRILDANSRRGHYAHCETDRLIDNLVNDRFTVERVDNVSWNRHAAKICSKSKFKEPTNTTSSCLHCQETRATLSKQMEELLQENKSLKERKTCTICCDLERNIIFLPCGHLIACRSCADRLGRCPLCRTTVKAVIKVYLSS